jgi:polyphosphate kinase
MAVVELKARFDEEANINWAERLEAVGAQVVYGIVGLKTHAKLLLVTRRERSSQSHAALRRYVHLSTGNYNAKTARLYTDISCFSADPELTADADAVFHQLASLTAMRPLKHLLVAPFGLHAAMLDLIGRVANAAQRKRPARIVLKCNALTDVTLINALIDASKAGAKIDLIIRGACTLPPGVPDLTENIRVRSIVGRFLEHSRIFYFRWGDSDRHEALYLSSADWMSRNMLRRIELAWPVRQPAMRQRLIDECLVPYLHDSRDAWELRADGQYDRAGSDEGLSAQQALLVSYCEAT